jgi:hypothetical protein
LKFLVSKKYPRMVAMKDSDIVSTEIVDFFRHHPKFTLEWVSCFFPLPIEWLRKYADILWWGERQSVDYDDVMSDSTSTSYIWFPGIIFNTNLIWTDEVRTLVASMLVCCGGELGLREYLWAHHGKDGHHQKDDLIVDMTRTLDFVSICPIKYDSPEMTRFDPTISYPQLNLKTDEVYSWKELKSRVESCTLLLSGSIWDNTTSQFLTKEVVSDLLNIFYMEHLKTPFEEADDNDEELPF